MSPRSSSASQARRVRSPVPLAQRELVGELMDDPSLDWREHARALASLRLLNIVSAAARPFWPVVRDVCARANREGRPARVLDVATGSGDVVAGLARRCGRAGLRAEFIASDISDVAIGTAEGLWRHPESSTVRLTAVRADALRNDLPASDMAMCSLFLHHLANADATLVLRRMAEAAPVVAVSDLRRTALGLALAYVAPRVGSASRIVHVDAVRSVRAAFTPTELCSISADAGLTDATVRNVWPQRMFLLWRRPS
jgi:2-polyprenyl-3-methyl-5-hydroxy-6-metoxy-1,4-benzoquinol methylase